MSKVKFLLILGLLVVAGAAFAQESMLATTVSSVAPHIVNRELYYYKSSWNAVGDDKVALVASSTGSFANVSSYSRGINGVNVDIASLPGDATVTVDDFVFKVGNNNNLSGWADAPAPLSVTVARGDGYDGSVRVQIIWPDGAIKNTWLQVTVKKDHLDLAEDDVFYFGSAIGEVGVGNLPNIITTGPADELRIRNKTGASVATVANRIYDIDRNGVIDNADELAARNNRTSALNGLKLIAI